MKSKAKRIDNGEWFEGYYVHLDHTHFIIGLNVVDLDFEFGDAEEIDPKTLCQQVRGTEFFEGDEFRSIHHPRIKGYLETDHFGCRIVFGDYSTELNCKEELIKDWKPTAKNIND